jgi:AbrB family looped-hinge helix DNA binding protein
VGKGDCSATYQACQKYTGRQTGIQKCSITDQNKYKKGIPAGVPFLKGMPMKELRKYGHIRRTDDLGRIIIPKEIRQFLNIRENEPLEISVMERGIYIEKYQPLQTLESLCEQSGRYAGTMPTDLQKKAEEASFLPSCVDSRVFIYILFRVHCTIRPQIRAMIRYILFRSYFFLQGALYVTKTVAAKLSWAGKQHVISV